MINKKGLKGKALFLIVSSVILSFVFVSFVSATANVTSPANNTKYSSTAFFNITYINGTDFSDAINATVYYNYSGVWTRIGNLSCTKSAGLGYCSGNLTINSTNGIFDGVYVINATLSNSTTFGTAAVATTRLAGNVTFDSTPPNVSAFYDATDNSFFNETMIINVSVDDVFAKMDSVWFNITNESAKGQVNFTKATASGGYYSLSVDTTTFVEGKYNITIFANDTLNNLNNTESIQITIDRTVPTATYACSPTSTTIGKVTVCTCVGTDDVAGVNNTYDGDTRVAAATLVASITTRSAGTFSRTCIVRDRAGNIGATVTATYTVTNPTSSGGGGSTTKAADTSTSVVTISPTTPATVSGFDSASGVKDIQVSVTQSVQNAQISVTKYTSKPTAISSDKSNAYKYFQIVSTVSTTALNKAVLKIQVEKSWVSSKGLDKEDVSLFKYDETASKWNALTTTYASEDSVYYYYTIDLNSFSYFAIAPESSTTTSGEQEQTTEGEQPSGTMGATTFLGISFWVWISIVVIAVAVVILLTLKRKKK
jgi:PGF-pre-PGF domain-containing protein